MIIEDFLVRWIGFLDVTFAYYVIQLGRAVFISIAMLTVIGCLRKTILKNTVFLKGAVWSILLLAPFMGKMKCIYETRLGMRLLFWWQWLCTSYRWLPSVYIAGMVISGLVVFRKRRQLKQETARLKRIRLHDCVIAVNELAVSPFTTGLLHPVIVVPRVMLNCMSDEELEVILLHERVHIRMGHLWYFLLWDVLTIVLWANPFLPACAGWFREDVEAVCDRVTMQKGQQTAYSYGSLLLKSIQMLGNENRYLEHYAAFAGEKQYAGIRQRMERVTAFKPYSRLKLLLFVLGCGALLVAGFTTVIHISYPRYTDYDAVYLYNKTGSQILVEDCDELREAVQIDAGKVLIDRKKLDRLLKQKNVDEDMFFVYWGGFSKLPGVGGGGNGIFVDYGEQSGDVVLPYTDNDTDWMTRIFRYLL